MFYIQSAGLLKVIYTSPPRRTVDSDSNSTSLGSSITREDYSLTFPPPSVARYSFIQPGELGRRGENENAQTSKR